MPNDPVATFLRSLNTSDRVRAAAFDAVYNMDEPSAERTLRSLPFSDEVRARLWDARRGQAPEALSFEQPPLEAEGPQGSAWSRFAQGANPLPALQALVTTNPLTTGKNVAMASVDQGRKAVEASGRGEYSQALGHAMGTLPLVGPAAAHAGERMASGDWAGGAGEALQLLVPFGLKYAREAAQTKAAVPTPARVTAARTTRQQAQAPIVREQAVQQVAGEFLNPGNPRYQAVAQRIAPEILRRDIDGGHGAVRVLAQQGTERTGQAMRDALAQYPKTRQVRVGPIVQSLDDAIAEMTAKGISGTAEVDPLMARHFQTLQGLRDFVARRGSMMTYDQLNALRQRWDRIANKAGGFAHKTGSEQLDATAWAVREAATAIRKELAKDRPDVAALKQEYAFYKDLGDVLDPTKGRPRPAKASPVRAAAARSAGTVGGAVSGHLMGGGYGSLPGAYVGHQIGAEIGKLLEAKVSSPAWKLTSARRKWQLADALSRGEAGRVKTLLLTIGEGTGELLPRPARENVVPFPKVAEDEAPEGRVASR